MSSDFYIILDAGELTELSFDNDAMLMGISNDFLRAFDVLFELILGAIEHNGREAIIDAGFAGLEIRTMIEVQSDRNIVDLKSCLDEVTEIRALGILACAGGSLEDNREFSSAAASVIPCTISMLLMLKAPMAKPPS